MERGRASLTGFSSTPGWLIDSEGIVARILPRGGLWFWLFDLRALSRGATGGSPTRLFNLYVLLRIEKDISHLGDVILHQIFIEGDGNLQSTDEEVNDYVLITVVYQGHLALKVVDIALQALLRFHFNYEEMVVVIKICANK